MFQSCMNTLSSTNGNIIERNKLIQIFGFMQRKIHKKKFLESILKSSKPSNNNLKNCNRMHK